MQQCIKMKKILSDVIRSFLLRIRATVIFSGSNCKGQQEESPPKQDSHSVFPDTINYSEVAPDPPGTHSGAHINAA